MVIVWRHADEQKTKRKQVHNGPLGCSSSVVTKDHHHMDKTVPSKELTEDMTRESLIAISYRVPDTDISAEMSPKKTNGEEVGETVVPDGEEKYRSELISISYSSPSPDVKVLPLLPVELDG